MIDKYDKLKNLKIDEFNIIELGCGPLRKFKESITIDIVNLDEVDIVTDISQGLSFLPDNSIDKIYSFHFLEHINDLEDLMYEIYRVLKKGGRKIGKVPHFSNPHFYSDYTHKRFFGLYTFYYMSKRSELKRKVPRFYNDLDFKVIEIRFNFFSRFRIRHYIKKIYNVLFNSSPYMKEYYEENLCYIFPANELYFVLEK